MEVRSFSKLLLSYARAFSLNLDVLSEASEHGSVFIPAWWGHAL